MVAEKSTPPEIRVTITPDARGKRDDNCTLVSSNVPPPYDKASNDGNTSHGAAVSRQGDNNTNNINNNTMSSAVLLSANKQQKAMLCRNYHMQSINTIPSHPLPISLSLFFVFMPFFRSYKKELNQLPSSLSIRYRHSLYLVQMKLIESKAKNEKNDIGFLLK